MAKSFQNYFPNFYKAFYKVSEKFQKNRSYSIKTGALPI